MSHNARSFQKSHPLATAPLAQAIARLAESDGDFKTLIPELSLHRRKGPTAPLHCIFSLGLGVVAQGHKEALVGNEVIRYGPGQSMLITIDLPVISHVTKASTAEPLLGLMLRIDPRHVMQTAADMGVPLSGKHIPCRPISIETLDASLLDALTRLTCLLEKPELAPHLAPLIQKEIIVLLLSGPHRPHLQHLAANGSPNQQIAKAVTWLKQNFAESLQMDKLAVRVGMSPSTFRQHFRALTGTSPLQYQKTLRLQEARQLMLSQSVDVGSASGRVGYESPSQFSREYSRLFGAPPQQDVRRMRSSAAVD
jgi:AraC-like DNA-binding protein